MVKPKKKLIQILNSREKENLIFNIGSQAQKYISSSTNILLVGDYAVEILDNFKQNYPQYQVFTYNREFLTKKNLKFQIIDTNKYYDDEKRFNLVQYILNKTRLSKKSINISCFDVSISSLK